MRKTLLMAGIAALLFCPLIGKTQINLSWLSSFTPSWASGNTSGSATNIGGYSINCSASATIFNGGSFMQALGGSGAQTPTVSGATFTVPGAASRLQITPNFTNNTGYVDIVLTFTSQATNVNFRIVDIDKNTSTSTTYYDKVTVTGSNGINTYNATLSKYDNSDPNFLIVSGNTANVNTTSGQAGNTASDATDQRGTVDVSFGTTSLRSIRIRYENAAGADFNPASQAIAIGAVSFSSSTLPIDLLTFTGARRNQDVSLNWITTQEFNSASFEIERSNGNNSWTKIGTVAAAGNSNTDRNYQFIDVNPQGAVLLYRLKQIDIDNSYKYSNIVRIDSKKLATALTAYPNPFTTQLSLNVNSESNQQVVLSVYDAAGKLLQRENKNLYTGNNSVPVTETEKLAGGIYFIEVKDQSGTLLGRTMVKKDQ